MTNATPNVGDIVTCAETGCRFRIKSDGFTFNYATNSRTGEILSDKGVDVRETRDLLDRTRPFGCYIDDKAENVTGWKGNILGRIVYASAVQPGGFINHGASMLAIRVRDVHGGWWYGRGHKGMFINLRPNKAPHK